MLETFRHLECPVCASGKMENIFQVKDYTVSGEMFWILECDNCSLRFTQDVPLEDEMAPYYRSENYISHTNTSKGIINSLYHMVRKRTLVRKRKMITKITGLQSGALLDIGSGTGSFLHEMKTQGWQARGLEPDEQARQVAKTLYDLDLEEMGQLFRFDAESFDAITLWHVLEHVHRLQDYIAQIKKILKSNGRLMIAVPNYTSLDASIYKQYWAAYDVPRHLYHFSPRSMQALMEKHRLKILQYKPMWYDSFYISMLSSKYKNGKTNLLAAGLNGLRSNLKALGDVKRCSSVVYVIVNGQ